MDSQGIYMASEGIYMTSQGIYMASEGIYMASEGIYMPSQGIYVYRTEREKRGGIFIIYMGCRRAIYNNIASSTSDFFRPRIKNALVQGRALEHFLTSDEKNLGLGAILLYIALRHPIYTLHI